MISWVFSICTQKGYRSPKVLLHTLAAAIPSLIPCGSWNSLNRLTAYRGRSRRKAFFDCSEPPPTQSPPLSAHHYLHPSVQPFAMRYKWISVSCKEPVTSPAHFLKLSRYHSINPSRLCFLFHLIKIYVLFIASESAISIFVFKRK